MYLMLRFHLHLFIVYKFELRWFLLIFSSADNSVRMWDRRNLGPGGGAGSPIHKFEGHKAAVLCVQACIVNLLVTYMFF
jgi:WD40 repeat protein